MIYGPNVRRCMPRIRKIEIQNFRGIKDFAWFPSAGINCLIGPGDSAHALAHRGVVVGRARYGGAHIEHVVAAVAEQG
jgi:hypothetical protein